MRIPEGTELVCTGPDRHVCGRVTRDIDSNDPIPTVGSGTIKDLLFETNNVGGATGGTCDACDAPLFRVIGSVYQIHTRHGWIGAVPRADHGHGGE
jgi:hypothetical protein